MNGQELRKRGHVVKVEDLKRLVDLIRAAKDSAITSGSVLTLEVTEYLATLGTTERSALFKTSDKIMTNGKEKYPPFLVNYSCPSCGRLMARKLSKSSTLGLIKLISCRDDYDDLDWRIPWREWNCPECETKRAARKAKKEEARQVIRESRTANINDFMVYLDPASTWNEDLKLYDRINCLWGALRCSDENMVAERIRAMSYSDFLATPYWKAISWKVKQLQGYTCALCPSKNDLNVHHRTYEYHGFELQRMKEDLICLCHECHEVFHASRPLAMVKQNFNPGITQNGRVAAF